YGTKPAPKPTPLPSAPRTTAKVRPAPSTARFCHPYQILRGAGATSTGRSSSLRPSATDTSSAIGRDGSSLRSTFGPFSSSAGSSGFDRSSAVGGAGSSGSTAVSSASSSLAAQGSDQQESVSRRVAPTARKRARFM